MKRIILSIACLFSAAAIKAQIAEWLIPPKYDGIGVASGIEAVVTDSSGVRTLWSFDGKRILTTPNVLYPFVEGRAVSCRPGSPQIAGIYREDGSLIPVADVCVAHGYPYFSEGKLLVQKDGLYMYMDKDGVIQKGLYSNAYPYLNGYSVYDYWMNFAKRKDLRHGLRTPEGMVALIYDDKVFFPEDVEFISSVNDENIGVVVIKRRVYFFHGEDKSLSPVFSSESETNLKNQAKLIDDVERCIVRKADSLISFSARCGKTGMVSFDFDEMLRPVSLTRNGEKHDYERHATPARTVESLLRVSEKDGLYGIFLGKDEMLPPQFEEVRICDGNRAFVRLGGKYGMLTFHKDAGFRLKMNKGDDIAFRHQKFETTIRVDLPTIVSADKTSIEIDPATGCDLDKTSKEGRNTDSGNYVQYNCVLNIPSSLPDELTEVEYPVRIMYDGLRSSVIPFKVNAWHYKYFVVDVDDSQTTIENGTVSFVFNINAERIASDGVYPTTVNIQADTLGYELEKMSETRYKCKVIALSEGVNNITVQIIEQGCPPATFPFEVEYHKPVAETRTTPAEKEKVTIKKKPKSAVKKSAPFVIMD